MAVKQRNAGNIHDVQQANFYWHNGRLAWNLQREPAYNFYSVSPFASSIIKQLVG